MSRVIKYIGGVLIWFICILLSLVSNPVRPLVSAAPIPTPTAVIQGLDNRYDAQGRYHSDLFSYSLKLPKAWVDLPTDGTKDHFALSPTRYIEVLSVFDDQDTTADLESQFLDYLESGGITPILGPGVKVFGVSAMVIYFADGQGGVYAEVAFVDHDHLWSVGEQSDLTHVARDRALFLHTLKTMRLEHEGL